MTTAPSPPDTPVPWLGVAAGDGAPLHPWSRGVRPGALLVVRYDFDAAEARRCLLRIVRCCIVLSIGIGFIFMFALNVGMMFATAFAATGSFFPPLLLRVLPKVLPTTFLYSIITPVAGLLLIYLMVYLPTIGQKQAPDGRCTVIVADAEGIWKENTSKMPAPRITKRKWASIKSIVCEKGDVFVFTKFVGAALYVPRSAFTDEDAANRFAAVATALWKAGGDASRINPAALAEFAA